MGGRAGGCVGYAAWQRQAKETDGRICMGGRTREEAQQVGTGHSGWREGLGIEKEDAEVHSSYSAVCRVVSAVLV